MPSRRVEWKRSAKNAAASTASWNPNISVLVPANYAPGVYSATITHSVA